MRPAEEKENAVVDTEPTTCTAFEGDRRIATGSHLAVAMAVKKVVDGDATAQVLIFDDETSRLVEFDLRGSPDNVRERMESAAREQPCDGESGPPHRRGPGRPKLGVVAKEITLLPRHWAWLGAQPGSASATLRRLVEDARRANEVVDQIRAARDSTYRFSAAIAGNQPGFEEAMRSLFAGDREGFRREMDCWPPDVRAHAERISNGSFAPPRDGAPGGGS